MKNKRVKIIAGLTVMILMGAGTVAGAMYKDKDFILSKNVSKDISNEKNTIEELIKLGEKALNEKKYDDAKGIFEKAIAKEVIRIDTYNIIIDKYAKLKRFDDAYYFTKLAIANNVYKENMSKKIDEIKKNFQVAKLTKTAKDTEKFTLPKTETININGEPKEVEITWDENNYDFTKKGNYVVNGEAKEYGRKVELTVDVTGKLTIEEAKQLISTDSNWEYRYWNSVHFNGIEYYSFSRIYAPNSDYPMQSESNYAINVETKEIFYHVNVGYIVDKSGKMIGKTDEQKAIEQEKLKSIEKMSNTEVILKYGVFIERNNIYTYDDFIKYVVENYIWLAKLRYLEPSEMDTYYYIDNIEETKSINGLIINDGESAVVFSGKLYNINEYGKNTTLVYVLANDKSKLKCYMRYDDETKEFKLIGEGGIQGYYFDYY